MSLYSGLLTGVAIPARDLLRGRRYARYRAFLSRSQWWSGDELRAFQWRELRKLLECAFESVPYYRQKYGSAGARLEDIRSWEDFAKLPPLTRAEVNAHGSDLCSTSFRGKLLPHATGGSSGVPTRFYRTFESYDWRTAARDRVYSWAGLNHGERTVYLWGAPLGKVSRKARWQETASELLQRRLVLNTFSQDEQLWMQVHARIMAFQPRTVVGYVSSLQGFSAFLQQKKLPLPPLKGIIAAAEPLLSNDREQIAAGFRAPVFNTYGSREFMSMAGECERHEGLHINAENVLLETAEPDRPAPIYVTDLHNFGMPFLRYEIGDVGTLMGTACECGRGLPRLRSVDGRVLDALRTADGRVVPGEFFPHLLKDIPEIREYQVVQRALDRIEIVAIISGPVSERSLAFLQGEIRKAFGGNMLCEIKPVARIPRLQSGKRRVTMGMDQGK